MRCKDMEKNKLPRYTLQVILCRKCLNPGGTMRKTPEGYWEHPNCNRPINMANVPKAVDITGSETPVTSEDYVSED